MSKKIQFAFIFVVFVLILAPFICMPLFQDQANNEKRTLTAVPSATSADGGLNVNILSDCGNYFEDHFAFRSQLIATDNALNRLLLTSGSGSVVVGRDGWLFYSGTLSDYKRINQLSERALQNIAHNLKLVQNYCERAGSKFVFVCPPNKNELYGQYMPYYEVAGAGYSNWQRLVPYLDEYGVSYVDVYDIFSDTQAGVAANDWGWSGEGAAATTPSTNVSAAASGAASTVTTQGNSALYLKTDSHWNTKGAFIATNAVLAKVNKELSLKTLVAESNLTGDLETLINPSNPSSEEDLYIEDINNGTGFAGASWSYDKGSSVEDSTIKTRSNDAGASGNLLMYRDSFGNALVPLFATAFESGTFSKLVPYNMLLVGDVNPELVVVERTQRHLNYLAEVAPIMQSPEVKLVQAATQNKNLDVELNYSTNGPFAILQGTLPAAYETSDAICTLTLKNKNGNSTTFEAFNTSQNLEGTFSDMEDGGASQVVLNGGNTSDYGFAFYLNSEVYDVENCEFVLSVTAGGDTHNIKTFEYSNLVSNKN